MPRFPQILLVLAATTACSRQRPVTPLERLAITQAIQSEVTAAYDLTKPDVVTNLMSLYATDTHVISASGGQVITSLDSIRLGVTAFWTYVGRNMQNPKVDWTSMYIDVLSPTAAVMTATYRIPHKQPNGLPHVIGGAWTAVFELRHGKWVIIQEHLSDNPYAS